MALRPGWYPHLGYKTTQCYSKREHLLRIKTKVCCGSTFFNFYLFIFFFFYSRNWWNRLRWERCILEGGKKRVTRWQIMKFTNYLHDPSNDIPQIVHQQKADSRHKDPLRQAQTNRSSWPDFSSALKNYEHPSIYEGKQKRGGSENELTDFMELLKIKSHHFMDEVLEKLSSK